MLSISCDDSPKQPVCKGLFFRVSLSTYRSKDTINKRRTYRLLKKMSCCGCPSCEGLWEDLNEQEEVIDAGEHGNIVELRMINLSTDWETGYIDSWDLAFTVIKDPHPQRSKE